MHRVMVLFLERSNVAHELLVDQRLVETAVRSVLVEHQDVVDLLADAEPRFEHSKHRHSRDRVEHVEAIINLTFVNI